MASKKDPRSKFHGCESAKDFVDRLDFLGIYLTGAQQRDLRDDLESAMGKRYNDGYNHGYDDGYYSGGLNAE